MNVRARRKELSIVGICSDVSVVVVVIMVVVMEVVVRWMWW